MGETKQMLMLADLNLQGYSDGALVSNSNSSYRLHLISPSGAPTGDTRAAHDKQFDNVEHGGFKHLRP